MSASKEIQDTKVDESISLLMRVIEVNQGLTVKNWDTIASKEGLSVATAKQRFGAMKKQFMATAGSAPAAPTIKRRKRAAREPAEADAQQQEEEEEEENPKKKINNAEGRTPLPTLADKHRAEAMAAREAHRRDFRARMRASRREWGLPVEEEEEEE
ncbi:hypothetical protein PG999_002895 [Apiospora kogelbergensis]|uniref:Uncharacterized protein n=1 Tax=Apiospora kogelbergensis TaxID=1337665 RepID=A0AAW0R9M7_9PEZI